MAKRSKKKRPAKGKPKPTSSGGARGSMRAYATHRGVSHTAVRRAIESGRLTQDSVTRNGRAFSIDFEAADREWHQNTDPRQQREEPDGGRPVKQDTLFAEAPKPGDDEDDEPLPSTATPGHRKAAERHTNAKAELAELQAGQLRGELVKRVEVAGSLEAVFRNLRDSLLAIPDRLGPVLAPECSEREAATSIEEEIRGAIERAESQAAEHLEGTDESGEAAA